MDNCYALKATVLLISGFQVEKLILLINKLKYLNKNLRGLRLLQVDLYLAVTNPPGYIYSRNGYCILTCNI